MGKTTGNMITMKDSPDEMFGKVMSWPDSLILLGFELCTDVSMEEIEKIKKEMSAGTNPRDIKVRLAKEVVKIYHSAEEADRAEENFVKTFKEGGVPEQIDEVKANSGELLSELAVKAGLVKSKGEFRRLVLEGAVSQMETNIKISDVNEKVTTTGVFKIGKRRFLKIILS